MTLEKKDLYTVNYSVNHGSPSTDKTLIFCEVHFVGMLCRGLKACGVSWEGGRQHLLGLEETTASFWWIQPACSPPHLLSPSQGQGPNTSKKQVCTAGLQPPGPQHARVSILSWKMEKETLSLLILVKMLTRWLSCPIQFSRCCWVGNDWHLQGQCSMS